MFIGKELKIGGQMSLFLFTISVHINLIGYIIECEFVCVQWDLDNGMVQGSRANRSIV